MLLAQNSQRSELLSSLLAGCSDSEHRDVVQSRVLELAANLGFDSSECRMLWTRTGRSAAAQQLRIARKLVSRARFAPDEAVLIVNESFAAVGFLSSFYAEKQRVRLMELVSSQLRSCASNTQHSFVQLLGGMLEAMRNPACDLSIAGNVFASDCINASAFNVLRCRIVALTVSTLHAVLCCDEPDWHLVNMLIEKVSMFECDDIAGALLDVLFEHDHLLLLSLRRLISVHEYAMWHVDHNRNRIGFAFGRAIEQCRPISMFDRFVELAGDAAELLVEMLARDVECLAYLLALLKRGIRGAKTESLLALAELRVLLTQRTTAFDSSKLLERLEALL